MQTEAKPRYRQIASRLRREIERGRYPVGSNLPTEVQLCERYGISRHTARSALRVLLDDGMIERRQGSGTVVTARERQRFNQTINSLGDLLQYGASTRLRIGSSRRVAANASLAALLGCDEGKACLHLRGVRSERAGGNPICVTDIYRVAGRDALTRRLAQAERAVYALVEVLDLDHVGTVEQRINAAVLDADTARELGIKRGSVCLRIMRRYIDHDGELILVAISQHPGSDFAYVTRLRQSR